jgi:hypothetical protein
MRAYVLIDSAKEKSQKIADELRNKPGVIVSDVINGPHPVIACVEGDNSSSIAQMILFDFRKIDGVEDLTVYLSVDGDGDIIIPDTFPDRFLPQFSEGVVSNKSNRKRKRSNKLVG